MTHPLSRQRRAVLRILRAVPLLCTVAAQAIASDGSEQCIVGDRAIGCVNERAIIELTAARKDPGTLKQIVQDKLSSGQCRLFDYGARVQAVAAHGTERTQVRRHGDKTLYWIPASWARPVTECEGTQSAATLHHKLGLPDATSQPAEVDERMSSITDEPASPEPRWDDGRYVDDRYVDDRYIDPRHAVRVDDARVDDIYGDDRYNDDRRDHDLDADDLRARDPVRRPPPRASRPLPSSRYAHDCRSNPAMTGADMAACRTRQR